MTIIRELMNHHKLCTGLDNCDCRDERKGR